MDIYRPLDSFSSVGNNQTATVALQPGPTYDEIHFEYPYSTTAGAELDKSHFTEVRVNLNGEDIVAVPAADLVMLEAYEGNSETNGRFTLSFRELIARTFDGVHATGLVTEPGDAISIEVDIAGAGAAATITLKAFAVTSPARPQRQFIPKLKKVPLSANSAGDVEVTTLPRGPRYQRIHFNKGDINSLTIERDQFKLYQLTAGQMDYVAKRNKRVPQAGWFHFDPIVDGFALAKNMVSTATSMVYRLNLATSGSFNALVESIWPEQKAFADGKK